MSNLGWVFLTRVYNSRLISPSLRWGYEYGHEVIFFITAEIPFDMVSFRDIEKLQKIYSVYFWKYTLWSEILSLFYFLYKISHSDLLVIFFSDCPNDVQVFVVNDLPIKEGDIVTLNCSVGGNIPSIIWFNWWKTDPHVANYKYSGLNLLTFPASFGPVTSYKCEACNIYGCTSSPLLTVDIFCEYLSIS